MNIAREHWRLFGSWPDPNRVIVATMECPGCGKEFSISTKIHAIAPDGTVTPSMVCPYPPCTFHAFIRLVDWTPPEGYSPNR